MRIVVDLDRCEANGLCEAVAPEIFSVGDDSLDLLDETPPDAAHALVEAAVAACPKAALRVER